MATTRIPDDVAISGNLTVSGSILPTRPRTDLLQEDFAPYPIPFTHLRIWDAFQTPISTAASDDLGLSTGGTFGTDAPYVTAGDLKAAGATTRRARFIYTLPHTYVAGQSVQFSAYAGMITTVADTSCTLDFEAYLTDRDGTVGGSSDLVTTSATTFNSMSFLQKTFNLNSAALAPGDVLDVRMTVACTDSATVTAVIPAIVNLSALLDVKG
jgi:hypothetical protein